VNRETFGCGVRVYFHANLSRGREIFPCAIRKKNSRSGEPVVQCLQKKGEKKQGGISNISARGTVRVRVRQKIGSEGGKCRIKLAPTTSTPIPAKTAPNPPQHRAAYRVTVFRKGVEKAKNRGVNVRDQGLSRQNSSLVAGLIAVLRRRLARMKGEGRRRDAEHFRPEKVPKKAKYESRNSFHCKRGEEEAGKKPRYTKEEAPSHRGRSRRASFEGSAKKPSPANL